MNAAGIVFVDHGKRVCSLEMQIKISIGNDALTAPPIQGELCLGSIPLPTGAGCIRIVGRFIALAVGQRERGCGRGLCVKLNKR